MTSSSSLVDKATSDLLIGPDWAMNMEICDLINSDPGQAREVVKAIKKRIGNKNGNVQILALTVLETIMKNCGEVVHQSVVEKEILPEMVKIVKKKSNMSVRDKILVLLDSWQEAFGGISGKYPQYYIAYDDLRRSGVQFPQRSAEENVPMFTPPATHTSPLHAYPYGSTPPFSPYSPTLEDVMAASASGQVWGSKDMDGAQSGLEVLNQMLNAMDPHDKQAVKDDLIIQLVEQCRSNQKSIMHLINSTTDERLLCQGLALNDEIQHALAKYDAIATGTPVSSAAKSEAKNFAVYDQEDDEAEDEFSQLAHRSRQNRASTSQESRSPGGTFAIPPPPQPVRRLNPPPGTKGQVTDLLSAEPHKDVSPKSPGPLSSSARQQQASSGVNPFIDGTTFVATQPSQEQKSPLSPNASSQVNHPSQYMQELDYSGYVAPWASTKPASSTLQQQEQGVQGSQRIPLSDLQKPDAEAHHLQGIQTSSAWGSHGATSVSSIPPPPINYTERQRYFQEQTTPQPANYSNLEQQTQNLSLQEAYNLSQLRGNQASPRAAKANSSEKPSSTDRLFEELVDFKSMSANLKKAGMTSSLTRSNKNT